MNLAIKMSLLRNCLHNLDNSEANNDHSNINVFKPIVLGYVKEIIDGYFHSVTEKISHPVSD